MVRSTEPQGERNIVGRRIREARMRSKPQVSQEDLAARLAVRGIYFDRSALSRMEAQKRFVRDYEIAAIAECLGVRIEWLFGKK
jgi:transcriptional regulator with XRE-family HTH domain